MQRALFAKLSAPLRQAHFRLPALRHFQTSRVSTASQLALQKTSSYTPGLAPLQDPHSHYHSHNHSCYVCSYRRSVFRYFGASALNMASSATAAQASTTSTEADSPFRLSRNILPTHYKLGVKTDLRALRFHGKVEIDLTVHEQPESKTSITLHAAPSLKIHAAVLSASALKTSSSVLAEDISYDKELERVTVTFPKDAVSIEAGQQLRLGLRFEGEIEGSMMGYYKSTYENSNGEQAYYALTQFEPTAARRAFPCFDEPDIKATYEVTLLSRKGLVALANMPVEHVYPDVGEVALFPEEIEAAHEELHARAGRSPRSGPHHLGSTVLQSREASPFRGHAEMASDASEGDGWIAYQFHKTPKISTYLVAWANGDFRHIESSYTSPLTGRKVPLRVYTTPEHIHQAGFALEAKAKVLPVYEKLFDIEYPLPKLDTLVASDFDAGAMENWGLITGRTVIYLFDEKTGSIDAKKLVASVQSHEVAHQWFGNVVTMKWWQELWLNEAFATLCGEVISIARVWPEWNPYSSFINAHLRRALDLDSQRSSHPIEVPCPSTEMINQIFDAISYSKGASVLQMLSSFLGEPVFLKGVSIYLKKNLYGNGSTQDLWNGISEASGMDVNSFMANWTLKVGFPVVTVEETSEGLKIRQNRFLATGDPTPEEDTTIWQIPLALKTVGKDGKVTIDKKLVLKEREITVPLEDASSRPYKLNADTTGVYRVVYPTARLAKLGEAMSQTDSLLSLEDRMGLVQDAFVLAKSGYGKTTGALELVKGLTNEKEFLVWKEVASGLAEISDVWWEQDQAVRDGLDKLSRDLFNPILSRLGWTPSDKESSDTRELRTLAVSSVTRAGDEAAIKECQRRFNAFIDGDEAAIPGDLLDAVFANAIRWGGETEYEKVKGVYAKPPTPQHKVASMRALCCSKDSALLDKTLAFMDSDAVKMQDIMYFYGGLAANPLSRRKIWAHLQQNLPALVEKFKGNFSLGRLVQYSFDRLTSTEDEKAVEKFFADKDTKAYDQSLKHGLEAVRAKIAWLQRDRDDVAKSLK